MGKKDFDIEFDFEEEYGFDPKAFLGTEEYDDNVDLNAFSDEELGLTPQEPAESEEDTAADKLSSDFNLDDDLDLDSFLNMGSEEEETEEEDPEAEVWAEEAGDPDEYEAEFEEEYAEEEFEEETDLPEDTEPEEIAMDENMEYTEEELLEASAYDEGEQEEVYEFDAEEPEEPQRRQRQKKERKPIQLPKLKTPNIFTKFYDLYFAPVLDKNWQNPEDPPQDPNAPRRRRRKSKGQIFKEVYLPPIIACVCLVLVMSFLIGTLSNVIEQRRIDQQAEQSRLESSISEAELAQQASLAVAEEAAQLAAGYDYQAAIDKLDSLGDLTQYPDLNTKRAEYITALESMVEYKDPTMIPNLSFHVLMEDPARAFKDEEYGGLYNRNFVTTAEFTRILQQLYDNGYVLVDFDSFVGSKTDVNGHAQYEAIPMQLPADKKPVMITETMVNYFAYMIDGDGDNLPDAKGDGFANKLVLDANGDIKAEYINADGQTLVGNYDLVPILEDFIKAHPDFSYRGARAILAVTGHEGVFGYRCNTSYIGTVSQSYYDQEAAGAKQIAQALRDKGYTIACFTYKNDKYANFNATNISADLQQWNQQVTTLIGPVDTFVFARESNISDYSENSATFKVMYDNGFRFFISNATGTANATTSVNSTYVRQNRLMVTGNSLAYNSTWFTGLFDCAAVIEATVRGNVPN